MRSFNRCVPKLDHVENGVIEAFKIQSNWEIKKLAEYVWNYYKQIRRNGSNTAAQGREMVSLRVYERLRELINNKKITRSGAIYTWIS